MHFDWVDVPAGVYGLGTDAPTAATPAVDETPRHAVDVPAFHIGRTPVTNAQYRAFVTATGHPPPSHWPGDHVPTGRDDHPVTYVDWRDAVAFCDWLGARLPSEAEWERSARGDDERPWPWGDAEPDASRANFGDVVGDTTPVALYPAGASPWGALDLAGNVWEWTSSLYHAYPYCGDDGHEDRQADGQRVVRGGTYLHPARAIRGAARTAFYPGVRDVYIGFRVASDDPAAGRLPLDWTAVAGGRLWMGSEARGDVRLAQLGLLSRHGAARPADIDNETPAHEVRLAAFRMGRTPVTNAEYARFVAATQWPAPCHWLGDVPPPVLADHPVTYIDWRDARAFCEWAGVRLPTEAEWEVVARGTDHRLWPWGDDRPDASRANYRRGGTTPVGSFPAGASPSGALDMAGNVWEWVSSAYRPYPYAADDGREDAASGEQRVLRGGSFLSDERHLRCAARSMSYPGRRRDHIGFRVASNGTL